MNDDLNSSVHIATSANTTAIDEVTTKLTKLGQIVKQFNSTPIGENIAKGAAALGQVQARMATGIGEFNADQRRAMSLLSSRFRLESRLSKQRAAEEKAADEASALFHKNDLARMQEALSVSAGINRQRLAAEKEAADAAERSSRARGRAAKQAAKDEADAARDAAKAWSEAHRTMSRGASMVRSGGTRAVVAGAVTGAAAAAGTSRLVSGLTRAGASIDDAMTQSQIHVYGQMSTQAAQVASQELRKKLMPKAVKLGMKTADLFGATVESVQAGVGEDVLDQTVELGSKFAKMNKLSVPNVLEESGYAIQGLKTFGKVTDETVGKFFNHSAYLIATTAANRTQMNSFAKRGLAAGASVGMSLDDSLAFGAAATAAGAEGSQAARMISSQGGRIAGWSMRAKDIQRKSHRTEEDRQFLSIPRTIGYSGFEGIAASLKKDFFGTYANIMSQLKKITDPLKRRSMEKELFGQEFGSFTDSMVMGDNLKDYRAKLNDKQADNFLNDNWLKQTGGFSFIIDQIKSVFQNLDDSLGLALKPFYSDLRDYVTAMPEGFGNLEDAFKSGLSGFMRGIGSPDGTMAGALRSIFGNPAGLQLNVRSFGEFGRGLGEGFRSVYETLKRFLGVFTGGDTSARTMGRLAAEFMGLSVALMAVSPLVGVIGGIGTALIGLGTIATGVMATLRAAGLVGGTGAAAGAAGAGAAGGAAKGALGALSRLAPAVAMPLTTDASKADQDRLMRRLGAFAIEQEKNKRALDRNTDALIQKQSYEGEGSLSGLIHKAALSSSDVQTMGARLQLAAINSGSIARAAAAGSVGAAMGAAGIGYTPGAGGSALSNSTPGGPLPDIGVGARYGMGGTGTAIGGSRSWRNSNPGNLKDGPFARRMGATGRDAAGFATFPDEATGRKAQESLLFNSDSYRNLSIRDAIKRYAPGSDGNDPAGYAASMAKAAGVGVDTRMSDLTPDQRAKFLDAQKRREGWQTGSGGGSPSSPGGNAVDVAQKFLGMGEHNSGRSTLERFVNHNIAGSANAWCARFVNASLSAVGQNGTGSAVANSFLRWGKAVTADMVQKGDVLVDHRGRGAGATGGHVGMATGGKRQGRNGELEVEMIAGNSHDQVQTTWERASKLAVRRAGESLGQGITTAGKSAPPGTDIGGGMKSSGWTKGSPEALAKESPAEKLAREAPVRPGSGAGGGGSSVHAPISVSGAGNPEETANAVQRKIQDLQRYRTHDMSFQSI